MSELIEIIPQDTLFFRGSQPMEAGAVNAASLFPPPVSAIKGALYTQSCIENNVPFVDAIPFEMTGFFIKYGDGLYAKAPSIWYRNIKKEEQSQPDETENGREPAVNLVEARKIEEATASNLAIVSSSGSEIVFVKPDKDAKPLGSYWISLAFLQNPKSKMTYKKDYLTNRDVFEEENRTGVALDDKKHTIKGKLYSSRHIRLNEGVSMVICLDRESGLGARGTLRLGGENRTSLYKKLEGSAARMYEDFAKSIEDSANLYLSLAEIKADEDNLKEIISSDKFKVIAGWDLKARYHKDSVSYIPAGAVFKSKVNDCCISVKHIDR